MLNIEEITLVKQLKASSRKEAIKSIEEGLNHTEGEDIIPFMKSLLNSLNNMTDEEYNHIDFSYALDISEHE